MKLLNPLLPSHVRPEYFWDSYRHIFILKVLDDGDETARERDHGTIESMNVVETSILFAVADTETARLERTNVGTARYLTELVLRWHPCLEVILFHGRIPEITRTDI